MTKPQCEAIIERLVDKTLSFGCEVIFDASGKVWIVTNATWDSVACYQDVFRRCIHPKEIKQIVGHPITKGRVAKMIAMKYRDEEFPGQPLAVHDFAYSLVPGMLSLWCACEKEGEDKSLQEILEGAQWEAECKSLNFEPCDMNCKAQEILKGPVKELFELLASVFTIPEHKNLKEL